jgi:hypothetical protein
MIIGTLASKTSLSEEMSLSLVDLVAKVFYNELRQVDGGKIVEMGVMVIFQIMQVGYIYSPNKHVCPRRLLLCSIWY